MKCNPSEIKGRIVVLHGLGVHSWVMWLLARRLANAGYLVENWGYGSIRQSLQRLIPHFEQRFQELQQQTPPTVPLYIVGHSMGSIIARAVAANVELPSLRKLIMLTPPNSGSHVATSLGSRLRWLTNLVEELSDREDSLVNTLTRSLKIEVGIIAADRDHLVSEPSTHLECEADHIVLPGRHTELVFKRDVVAQILHFIEHGTFCRDGLTFEQAHPLQQNRQAGEQ
ncbi:esterase/lipase family protein [Planctomicrobium sp. SH664]|uniref:esterase/lipase family protein n=1 Tax=Planctomicrobium sp. SH664 TaxID=3448125 RepID=UPI003F5BD336